MHTDTDELNERLTRIKDSLISATRIISSRLDLQDALHEILSAAKRLINARYGALAFMEKGQLTNFIQEGISDEEFDRIGKWPSLIGLKGTVFSEKQTVCSNDVTTDSRFFGFPQHHPNITSFLGTPIVYDKEILGMIYLGDKTDGKGFTGLDQEILESLATHAAVSINNARLYRQMNDFNRTLEDRIKERTLDMESAMVSAQIANQAKSRFLTSMSHELRTPLNAILGFSQVLDEEYVGPLNNKQKEYVQDILKSGWHLLHLIDDILDLSRIEAGKVSFEPEELNLDDLIEDSLLMIREKAIKHAITLKTDIDTRLQELPFVGDRRKMKQILFNLLSNAAKFTPDGGMITVRVRLSSRTGCFVESGCGTPDSPLDAVTIIVEDTGIGIEPEYQDSIFQDFFQVHDDSLNKTPGTGLGLPISRKYVEMHDGRIWVESDGHGKGSRFFIELPIRRDLALKGGGDQRLQASPDGLIQKITRLIQSVKPLDGVFTICRIGCSRSCSSQETQRIESFLKQAKRDYDLLDLESNDRIYLILLFSNEAAADHAWKRIVFGLESLMPQLRFHMGMASYPKDGDTPKELIDKLMQVPQ